MELAESREKVTAECEEQVAKEVKNWELLLEQREKEILQADFLFVCVCVCVFLLFCLHALMLCLFMACRVSKCDVCYMMHLMLGMISNWARPLFWTPKMVSVPFGFLSKPTKAGVPSKRRPVPFVFLLLFAEESEAREKQREVEALARYEQRERELLAPQVASARAEKEEAAAARWRGGKGGGGGWGEGTWGEWGGGVVAHLFGTSTAYRFGCVCC